VGGYPWQSCAAPLHGGGNHPDPAAAPPESGGEPLGAGSCLRQGKETVIHDVHEKTRVIGNSRELPKLYVIDAEDLAPRDGCSAGKRELKNEGLSCDVIENKYIKNVDVRVTCDVYENK